MFMAAALLLATALGGCAVYPDYSCGLSGLQL
jgi:hypothetical protein